jgi:hypothetical protein
MKAQAKAKIEHGQGTGDWTGELVGLGSLGGVELNEPAKDSSVLKTEMEVFLAHVLVGELIVQHFLDPCSALYFLVDVVFCVELIENSVTGLIIGRVGGELELNFAKQCNVEKQN